MQPGAAKRGAIVADDSVIIRHNVREALGEPWRIFPAVDGVEAIEYARRVDAKLVLLDLRMPRVDGIGACALIRSLPRYGTVPIVLLTAYDDEAIRRRAAYAGATTVLSKPFSAAVLQEKVLPLVESPRVITFPGEPVARAFGLAEPAMPLDVLAADRDVLAIQRQVEAAARQRRYARFAEVMAAWRAQSRR